MKHFIQVLFCTSFFYANQPIYANDLKTITPERQAEWWSARHEAKLKEIQKNKKRIDLVFIGDSITHFMDQRAPGILKRHFPEATSLNLGYSADRTENVLWRLRNGEIRGLKPKLTIIMIGTNNTGHRMDPAQDTTQGIELIINEIREQNPSSKILLLSIFPRGLDANDKYRKRNSLINERLPSLADQKSIFHLNINDKFLDPEAKLSKELMPDLLHPNQKGYEVWIKAIKPTVHQLLKTHN